MKPLFFFIARFGYDKENNKVPVSKSLNLWMAARSGNSTVKATIHLGTIVGPTMSVSVHGVINVYA